MKIKKINYIRLPRDLDKDCLDIFVILNKNYYTDGHSYLVEVAIL